MCEVGRRYKNGLSYMLVLSLACDLYEVPFVLLCVRVCVCVCVRERERERMSDNFKCTRSENFCQVVIASHKFLGISNVHIHNREVGTTGLLGVELFVLSYDYPTGAQPSS